MALEFIKPTYSPVVSVNGMTGDVVIEAPEVDLTGYATESYVDEKVADIDLTGYATEAYVDRKVAEAATGGEINLDGYATKQDLEAAIKDIELTPGPQGEPGEDGYTPVKGVDYFDGAPGADGKDGSDYVLTEEDKAEIAAMVNVSGGEVDLTNYYTKSEVDSAIEQIELTPGPQGEPGQDGYTPIKGVDYFDGKDGQDGANGQDYVLTEEDKAEIAAMVDVSGGSASEDCIFINSSDAIMGGNDGEDEYIVALWREWNDNGKIKTDTEVYFQDLNGNLRRVIDYQMSTTGFFLVSAYDKELVRIKKWYNMGSASSNTIASKTTYVESATKQDLSSYATTEYVDDAVAGMSVDLTDYATTAYVDEAVAGVSAGGGEVDLSGYATTEYVDDAVAGAMVDLTDYATTEYVDNAVANAGGGSSSGGTENCVFVSTAAWILIDEEPENEFAVAFWREWNDNGKIKTDTEVYFQDASNNTYRVIDYKIDSSGFYIMSAFNKYNTRYTRYYNMGSASSTAIVSKGTVTTEAAEASGKSWNFRSVNTTETEIYPSGEPALIKIVGYWDDNKTSYVNYEIAMQGGTSWSNNNETHKHYIYDPIKSKAYYFGYHLWMSPANFGISLYELDGTKVMGTEFHVTGYYQYI